MGNTATCLDARIYMYQSTDWPWVWALRDPEILDWKVEMRDDSDSIQSTAMLQSRIAYEPLSITPTLFLGSSQSVQNVKVLQQLGITHVLNAADRLAAGPVSEYQAAGIEYLQLNAEDEYEYAILDKHWNQAKKFIQDSEKCVVHCHAGMNRSGIMVAAALLTLDKHRNERENNEPTDVLHVVKWIRHVRGNFAITNEGFQEQLVAFARLHDVLGPMPGTEGSIVCKTCPPERERALNYERKDPKHLLSRMF